VISTGALSNSPSIEIQANSGVRPSGATASPNMKKHLFAAVCALLLLLNGMFVLLVFSHLANVFYALV
jgi:hypothetical protein